MQHFRAKLFAQPGLAPDLGAAIPVFHRFIQTGLLNEPLIDVADYRHVPDGPGVILVGQDGIYSLDSAKGRLGITYTRRTVLQALEEHAQNGAAVRGVDSRVSGQFGGADGALCASVRDRIHQALRSAVGCALQLSQAPEFGGRLQFGSGELEISVNDRLLAPNNEATWTQLKPDLTAALDAAWGAGAYQLRRTGEPRELFTVSATCATAPPIDQLLLRL